MTVEIVNANERVRLDKFFSRGGTVVHLERLAQELCPTPISIDDLSLEWALDQAERQIERCSAQYVRRDGCLVYAVPLAGRLALVSSDGNVTLASNDGPVATRATLSPQAIRRYRRDERVDLAEVITRVRELLVTHVQFSETWQADLISLWVTGTFMYSLFAVFGYLHITSAGKRCGKTLLLDMLAHLCFNATRSSTDPSPAFVFRDAERNCGTQLFDEVENLTDGDRRSHAPLMAMLNAGFRRGAESRASWMRKPTHSMNSMSIRHGCSPESIGFPPRWPIAALESRSSANGAVSAWSDLARSSRAASWPG
jgi:hypothetical protein